MMGDDELALLSRKKIEINNGDRYQEVHNKYCGSNTGEGQHLMGGSGSLTLATMTDSLMSVLGGTWGSVRRTQRSSSILGGLSRTRLVWRAIGEPNWREREASGIRRW